MCKTRSNVTHVACLDLFALVLPSGDDLTGDLTADDLGSLAPAAAAAQPQNDLFTDAGSPKYVNTSAILRQQGPPSKLPFNNKAVSPRNLGPDFNSVAEINNPRLQPVTSLQQVLYNKTLIIH